MARYIAFLRAINVGGRNVKMDELRRDFGSLGFADVETYIASGNVIFAAPEKNTVALEERIAATLRTTLGYEVAVFIRTDSEVARITHDIPFPQDDLEHAAALNIAFLHQPLTDELIRRLMDLRTDIDSFAVQGREVFWMCLKKQSESSFSNAVLEKTIGMPATMRGINTIRKIAAKYC